MNISVEETIETALKKNTSLRMACYSNAINKVHDHFTEAGMLLSSWKEYKNENKNNSKVIYI